jgi:hypothetical protein
MKIKSIVWRLAPLFLTLPFAGAQEATLYVSTNGSDSNAGTSTQPFQTITHAYSLAGPGTTIIVLPGVYTDYTSGWGLHLGSSGTASRPIVLESQVRGAAIIDGKNASDRNLGIYLDGSYNVVDGFGIRNGPNGGISIWGNGNQILNSEIYSNGNPASTSTDGRDGIYSDEGTSANVYVGNLIYDNGRQGSTLDHGLYLCGQNEMVVNNVVYGNAACGLQVAGYTTVSNLRVYNNVFAWNGTDGIILWQALSGVDIENNILYQNGQYGLGSFAATGSGVVVDANLFFGNGYGEYEFTAGGSTFTYTLDTVISADPQFVNETLANFDAQLGASSPAIGVGLNLYTAFTTDLAGTTRSASGQWDLGAYVYGSVSSLSLPTVTVVANTDVAVIGTTNDAVVTFARTGDTAQPLTVNFSLAGSAVNGTDYREIGGAVPASVTIPAGSSLTNLTVIGVGNSTEANPETAIFTLETNADYTVGAPSAATITIVTDSVATVPIVSVTATTPNASRVGSTDGIIAFTRSGSTASSLTVEYSLGGTAVNGVAYSKLATSAIIPAGASSATLTVAPLASASYVGAEAAALMLSASAAYAVGAQNNATVNIAGNNVPIWVGKTVKGDMEIVWQSVVGKTYRLAYANSLNATTWTNLGALITATTKKTEYIDVMAPNDPTRYYLVYVTD